MVGYVPVWNYTVLHIAINIINMLLLYIYIRVTCWISLALSFCPSWQLQVEDSECSSSTAKPSRRDAGFYPPLCQGLVACSGRICFEFCERQPGPKLYEHLLLPNLVQSQRPWFPWELSLFQKSAISASDGKCTLTFKDREAFVLEMLQDKYLLLSVVLALGLIFLVIFGTMLVSSLRTMSRIWAAPGCAL